METKSVVEVAKHIAALPKSNNARSRLVVFTQGAHPTITVQDGLVKEFPVIPIDVAKIVDTNGAGDAFCGGFMSQYVQGKPLEACIAAGNYVANVVIQRSGPTYPDTPHQFCFSAQKQRETKRIKKKTAELERKHMFGCVVAGRSLQTNIQQVEPTKVHHRQNNFVERVQSANQRLLPTFLSTDPSQYVFILDDAEAINHLGEFSQHKNQPIKERKLTASALSLSLSLSALLNPAIP